MTIEYKIIGFNEVSGQIIVRYRDLAPIAIDLPIDDDNNIPVGEALHTLISNALPVWHFERIDKLNAGLKQEQVAEIKALIQEEPAVDTPVVDPQIELKQLIFEVLVEQNLIQG